MQETNYCAHAIDSLRALRKLNIPEYLDDIVSALVPKLLSAAHFRLPEDGRVFSLKSDETIIGVLDKYCPLIRLPYPAVSLEFGYSSLQKDAPKGFASVGATILEAHEQEIGGRKCIVFSPLFLAVEPDGGKQWYPAALGATLDVEDRTITPFGQRCSFAEEIREEGSDFVMQELHGGLTVFVQFLAALSCSNSATAEAPPPNPALNAKRRKAGKTPFFTYKILTISGNSAQNSEAAGGTHGAPRVHLRRGHIRRLPEKTVWVNACVVGDKSKGLVQKDYRVK